MVIWTENARMGEPYWQLNAAPAPKFAAGLPPKADILIIGAGYTGLSAAIAAHDTGADVVVLDREQPGAGASSRNGGMFGAHPRLGWRELAKLFGEAVADALFAEAKPALECVKSLIADEKIDCDLQHTGRIQLAWTAGHFEALKTLAEDVAAKSEVQAHIVERRDLAAEINTDRYFGGLVLAEHCGIDPQKLHLGLVQAAQARGIKILANCEVSDLARKHGGFVATTPLGRINADKVILATNGYTTDNFRWFQRRVFPLPSYLIATEELPEGLIAHLAPGGRMMVETRARHSYFRASPDGKRILFGGRASMRDLPLDVAAKRQHATMCEVWPELSQTRLSHVWKGFTGYTFNHMPHVGCENGLHYALGFSGSGTVMATYLGRKVALQATGAEGGETAYSQTRLATSWLHPFTRPHFLKAADLWYRTWVDTRENYLNRQGRSPL
ncbi:MAG: FAD-binding oxidoreductase [Alphaproteobacteria bacterium]|nr:FAD-binding oxidoreductase [Alphaproteobacteria bacterium]